MEVFWQQGYQGASVQDLVEATGLQRGSLYGAFGDKRGLFMAALSAYAGGFVEALRSQLTGDDPLASLRQFIRDSGDGALGHGAVRGCMVGNTCAELSAHDDEAREHVAGFVAELRDTMSEALQRAQANGTFGADRDPQIVATFLQCGLQGLALLARTRPEPTMIYGVVDEILRSLD
ncbi:MAG: TetR/AcrR family transcriptional repressor of nem operon [Myxococcota bacterium]|jgi:TetR/AcrR family transcriptional repressor of nem operon